ncbi:MAG: hypothetical protein HFJ42_06835 [Clostridia bacterium]|nr:hypothetical protein [Clostridia bacterium]
MKKKIILVAIIIVLAIVGVVGYMLASSLMQEITLRKEADAIGKLDITKDSIDMEIKTKGDYGVVEKTMKEYMNTYGTTCKELMDILQDDQMGKILTAENYKNDGKEFIKTKEYITKTKTDFNEKINKLIEMSSEEKMMEVVKEKQLEESYVELYKEIMLGNEIKEDLQEVVSELEEASKAINNRLEVEEKIINLLVENKNKWNVNDNGEIEFETQKLVDEYNNLISSL